MTQHKYGHLLFTVKRLIRFSSTFYFDLINCLIRQWRLKPYLKIQFKKVIHFIKSANILPTINILFYCVNRNRLITFIFFPSIFIFTLNKNNQSSGKD